MIRLSSILIMGFMGVSAWAGMSSGAKCGDQTQSLVDRIEENLKNDTRGRDTIASAYGESKAAWETYTSKRVGPRALKVSELGSDDGTIEREMDPGKNDSTNAIAKNSYSDIHILAEVLKMKREGKSVEDLSAVAEKYKLNPKNGYFQSLSKAYQADDGTGKKLIDNTIGVMEAYRTWLQNGVKDLEREEKRIKEVYLNPKEDQYKQKYGDNLKGDDAEAMRDLHGVLKKSIDANMAMRSALASMMSDLAGLRNSAEGCGISEDNLNQLAGLNPVQTTPTKSTNGFQPVSAGAHN